jgi:hypothetical protein
MYKQKMYGYDDEKMNLDPMSIKDTGKSYLDLFLRGATQAEGLEEAFHAKRQERNRDRMGLRDEGKTWQDQRDADRERMALIANQSVMGNNAFASAIGR